MSSEQVMNSKHCMCSNKIPSAENIGMSVFCTEFVENSCIPQTITFDVVYFLAFGGKR